MTTDRLTCSAKATSKEEYKIGIVILTYNSLSDFPKVLEGIICQRNIETPIIVVDNASLSESRDAMEQIFLEKFPNGIIVEATEAKSSLLRKSPAVFVRSSLNTGYSAGNNIGARLAVEFGCDAVFVINPDVRISNQDFVSSLWLRMLQFPNCQVASSRVLNLSGFDENPLRETGFWDEFFWFRQLLPGRFKSKPMVVQLNGDDPIFAEKLHGCCIMIRSSALEEIGFFDENVFLYSEEPILAARVHSAGGKMMIFPELEVVHAHVASTKGEPSKRMLHFIKSRLYYINTYSNYNGFQKKALRISYFALAYAHRFRSFLVRCLGG